MYRFPVAIVTWLTLSVGPYERNKQIAACVLPLCHTHMYMIHCGKVFYWINQTVSLCFFFKNSNIIVVKKKIKASGIFNLIWIHRVSLRSLVPIIQFYLRE